LTRELERDETQEGGKEVNHKKLALIVAVTLLAALFFSCPPNVYAWDASPQITSDVESDHTVLIIQFTLPSYFGLPTPSHYPFQYQIRIIEPDPPLPGNQPQYLEYPPVSIQRPTTALFTVRYNFSAYIRYWYGVQARLHDNQVGWSEWGPSQGAIVPEFPYTATLVLATTLLASAYLLRRR
jgi:hypothetical protein